MMILNNTTMLHLSDLFVMEHFVVEPANYPCGKREATIFKVKSINGDLVAEFWTNRICPNILYSLHEPIDGAVVHKKSGENVMFNHLNTKNYAYEIIECVTEEYK